MRLRDCLSKALKIIKKVALDSGRTRTYDGLLVREMNLPLFYRIIKWSAFLRFTEKSLSQLFILGEPTKQLRFVRDGVEPSFPAYQTGALTVVLPNNNFYRR